MGARFREHGYAVETLEPGPGLVRKLRQALATEDPLSAVVIVFCGYVLLTESREPALLLSDEQVIALRLEQLCSKAARTFGRVLFIIDGVRGSSTKVVQEANPGGLDVSPEILLGDMAAKTVRYDNTGLLLSLAPWATPDAVPDHGLCQRLSDILGELDDSQAMSTPELEFTLNGTDAQGSYVTCRHSKPAFVFLPARRFHSRPPSPSGATLGHQQWSGADIGARVDASVDPYDSRLESDERQAWTPPPDTPTPLPTREPRGSRPSFTPSATHLLHLPTEGALPPPPLPPLPQPSAPSPAAVSGPPPPLPEELVPHEYRHTAPTYDGETRITPPHLETPERASSEGMVRSLGVPPPLPGERADVLPQQLYDDAAASDHPELTHESSHEATRVYAHSAALGAQVGATPAATSAAPPVPLVTPVSVPPPLPRVEPPPLPRVEPPPLPRVEPPPLPYSEPRSLPRVESPPLPEASALVPPPLPTQEPGASTQGVSHSVSPTATDATAGERHEANTTEARTRGSSSSDAPAPAGTASAHGNTAAARSGPPPRRHRDSGNTEAVPSLPPLALSPESWRPQSFAPPAPRDEAMLLSLANAALTEGNNELALEHASQCLDTFPESASALQIVATVLVGAGQFERLASVYDRLIAVLAPVTAAQLCAAAARLWHNQLGNTDKAREFLERGLRLDANNASLQREFADLLDASGDTQAALHHAFAAVRLNPMSPQAANAAFQRLDPSAARERTFNVACVLSFLGQANNRVTDVVMSHRNSALPKPTRALNDDDFALGLDVTVHDPELTRLLAQLEPLARTLGLPKPKAQRQLLDSLRAEDVERSTTMLARTFGWTCRLLGLGAPGLFLAESDALPARLPVEQVSFVVGKSLGRGLSLSELVFIWARSLSMARSQTRILQSLPSPVKLVQFVHACRCVVGAEQATNTEVKQLVKALKKLAPDQTWAQSASALTALGPHCEMRIEQWKHEADRVANSIGLVACGDPELAARTLDRFPLPEGAPRRQQLGELLSFALSDEYETLRARLGLHLG